MKQPNSFYKRILLPIVASTAGVGIALLAILQVTARHHDNHDSQTTAATNVNKTQATTNTPVTSNEATLAKPSTGNTPALTQTNTQITPPTGNTTVQNQGPSTGTAASPQSPADPGLLGQPATQPAGPTPPPNSPVGRVTASAKSSIEVGDTDQVVVHAYDKHGNLMNPSALHVTFEVIQGVTAGTSVNNTGLFAATAPSLYIIRTKADGVYANDVTINVVPRTHPYHVTLRSTINLLAGSSQPSVVTAHVVDVNGHDVAGAHVTFMSSNPTLVRLDRTQTVTDENGMVSTQATSSVQSVDSSQSSTITAVVSSIESATLPIYVNVRPASIQLVGHAVTDDLSWGHFVIVVLDAKGKPVPYVGVMPNVAGGASLGVNQVIFISNAQGLVTIPTLGYYASPAQVTITVPGTDVSWSGTVTLQ